MNEAEKICDEIQKVLPNIKPGSLRFWGLWFGKPYDNVHRMVAAEHDGDLLRLRFDGDELLTIWSPAGLEWNSSEFRISDAERVLWQWFYYGRPRTDANHFFLDLVRMPESIVASTNANRYSAPMKTNPDLPAAELLTVPTFPRINAS
jgi:hypothetical protein